MPTSWRPRTPTNLEVRPLPGRGGSSLTHQLQLYLLQAFSYPPTLPHFSFATHPFSSMRHQWHQVCLFVFQQCVKYASFWNFLCSISWSCTLTAGGHVCHHVTSSQQSLNHDKIFSVYVFSSDYGRLTTDWCVFANVCGQIPVHAGTFWLILAFVNQFEWLIFFYFLFLQGLCDIRIEVEKTNVILLSSVPFSHPTPTPPLLPLFLTLSLFRYCHLSAGEAALSVHRARQSQSASHWGSAWQCQQGAGAGAEVSWQG